MEDQCILAEFGQVSDAKVALEVLAKADFSDDQISVIKRKDAPELEELGGLTRGGSERPGTASGAGIGGLLGGSLAAPLAASTLVGPFILVGPLVGVGLGAAIGGLLTGEERWGQSQDATEHLKACLDKGGILVVITGDDTQLRRAEATLQTVGPDGIQRFARAESQQID